VGIWDHDDEISVSITGEVFLLYEQLSMVLERSYRRLVFITE